MNTSSPRNGRNRFFKILPCTFLSVFISSCNTEAPHIRPFILPFDQVAQKADLYKGIQFLSVDSNSHPPLIRSGYDYLNNTFGDSLSFDIGLSAISRYYSTGDEKCLTLCKGTASLLDTLLPANGLIPTFLLNRTIKPRSIIYTGTSGQANTLCFVCALANVDSTYDPLCKKLADGLLRYGLDPRTNLAYSQLDAITGRPYDSPVVGHESQLGSGSSAVAQSLLFAFKTLPSQSAYRDASLKILKSIWKLRDPKTNLIAECYDVYHDKAATKLYPVNAFRYDDMGGAYVRALTFAYQQTHDPEIHDILNTYIAALLKYTWDTRINGGGFRYVTDPNGKGAPQLETMYGLFTATLLEASQYVDSDIRKAIVDKCTRNADHVYLTDYGVKYLMIPHNLSEGGTYTATTNDSQLAYAVIQFPLGMALLTQATNDTSYIYRTNYIINTLLDRHKAGDNVRSPMGFVNIIETQKPYGLEHDYSTPSWCFEMIYLPAYELFADILPNDKVKINWLFDNAPCVFGLVAGMPYWDLDKVNFNRSKRILELNDVESGEGGAIDLQLLGYDRIAKVLIDGDRNGSFQQNTLLTTKGHHSYTIYFDR